MSTPQELLRSVDPSDRPSREQASASRVLTPAVTPSRAADIDTEIAEVLDRTAPSPDQARPGLPTAPTDDEKYLYLASQWRWVTPFSFLGYALIVISIAFFVYQHDWAWFVLLPLAVTTLGALVSLFTSSRRRRDSRASHDLLVTEWRPSNVPSVDVFLPSAGESIAVLRNTYEHVSRLSWDGELRIYVLDDSGRDEVADLARHFGFNYIVRPDRGHFKKAGNLRHGFSISNGDYILVLDADFVPRPDALRSLAPYFEDSQVAIVQSPQFFDITREMNWLERAAGATQILFYRWVQPSRDRKNAAICVGTSAMYRRSALNESGGYALIGHSEDVHTGVNLMAVGYRIRYVPVVVTKGLCPDELDQFYTQQYRWCTGSMSLLFSRRFHKLRLTFAQRLCYWSGFLYYITTAINVFLMSVPGLLMIWFVPGGVTPANYIFVALAMVTRQTVVPFITLQSESMMSLTRVQMTYSFCHALALFDVVRGRTDSWVATGSKTRSRTSVRVRRLILSWCVGVQVLMWSGIAIHMPTYGLERWWVTVLFACTNLYLVIPLIFGRADFPTMASLGRKVSHGVDAMRSRRFRVIGGGR